MPTTQSTIMSERVTGILHKEEDPFFSVSVVCVKFCCLLIDDMLNYRHGALGGLNARRGAIKFNDTIQGMANRKGVSVVSILNPIQFVVCI